MVKRFVLTLAAFSLLGLGTALAVDFGIGIRIGPPPPPRVACVWCRRLSGPGYTWVGGYWYADGSRWRWRDGYWTRPPYAGAMACVKVPAPPATGSCSMKAIGTATADASRTTIAGITITTGIATASITTSRRVPTGALAGV